MTDRMVIKRINLNSEKLKIKTKLAFGIGATGEGAANWIFAALTFLFSKDKTFEVSNLTPFLCMVLISVVHVFVNFKRNCKIYCKLFNLKKKLLY